jgi:hypothetical protein
MRKTAFTILGVLLIDSSAVQTAKASEHMSALVEAITTGIEPIIS